MNTSRLILEILGRAYKYSLNMEMSEPWAKGEDGEKLVDSKIYRNSADDLQLQISDVLNTNGATKVKAFLWESLEGCKQNISLQYVNVKLTVLLL